jgi:hypothetical protein
MAVTQVTTRNVVIENVVQIPKSAAKVAAAFLVLQPYPYVVAHDLFRTHQALYFQEPEVQIQPWKGSLVVITNATPISPAKDARRAKQATFFPEVETQIAPQKSYLNTLASYAQVASTLYSSKSLLVENVTRITSWKGTINVLNVAQGVPQSSDVFSGHDTQGWPLESFEPPTFLQTWKSNAVITNSFPVYTPATDRRSKQALYYPDVEFYIQPWKSNVVVLNTFPVYNPAIDRRSKQSLFFVEPESYLKVAPFNQVIINGTIAAFVGAVVPPTLSVWTADATSITCDSIFFTWDGADLINGGASGTPQNAKNQISYTVSPILRF